MNAELKQYIKHRATQRILELDLQEREEIEAFNSTKAIETIKKKCNLYDLKSVIHNLK